MRDGGSAFTTFLAGGGALTIMKITAQAVAASANNEIRSFLIAGTPVNPPPFRPEKAATACQYAGIIGSLSLISNELFPPPEGSYMVDKAS